jgi:hypothetical protein
MHKLTLALTLLTSPAFAWDFTSGAVCTLSDATDTAEIVLTYDPALPRYTLSITTDAAWPVDGTFSMTFANTRPAVIRTDRQTLSQDGMTLSVADSGFGNVLNGLEFGGQIRAAVGDRAVDISSDGIKGPMGAFKACGAAALS